MNPSASGWTNKHLPNFINFMNENPMDEEAFYAALRSTGFIYGHSVETLFDNALQDLKWTLQEKTKINLFDALVFTFYDNIVDATPEGCLRSIINFYRLLDKKGSYVVQIPLSGSSPYAQVEKIIHQRIQTNESLLQKNFSHLITNALVYIDVLSFDHFLITGKDPLEYAKKTEAFLTETVWLALQQKETKDKYNKLLIKLFESSVRYNTLVKHTHTSLSEVELNHFNQPLEQLYLLDLCSLSSWDDAHIDKHERSFLLALEKKLGLPVDFYKISLKAFSDFMTNYGSEMSFLNYSNPAKHFYNQTTSTVKNLIERNKKRLVIEIMQSKELAVLLAQSARRDLTKQEKKIVKNQLMDIFKSIPSLAIFLLPGGGLLLPIFVKLVPTLLPSAFRENSMDED